MIDIELKGETFQLMAERCVYRKKTRTLLAADLHWGKAEVFQKSGIAVPSSILHDDLARLSRAICATGATRLLILGDLIHAKSGVTDSVVATVAQWREQHADLTIDLVRGNHDRGFAPPESWRMNMFDEQIVEAPFIFAHDPPEIASDLSDGEAMPLAFCGHLHPMLSLTGRTDRLRLQCFAMTDELVVLPAFSFFTAGVDLNFSEWKRLFAIADNTVLEV